MPFWVPSKKMWTVQRRRRNKLGWLLGSTLASMVTSFIIVRIFDLIFGEVTNSLVSIARGCLFIGTWTTVTASAGMSGVKKRVRQLKQIAQRRI